MTTPTSSPNTFLVAMLRQEDGPRALLQRAGVNVQGLLAAAEAAMHKRPSSERQDGYRWAATSASLMQAAEKEAIERGDQFIASELFLLSLADIELVEVRRGGRRSPSGLTR